MMKTIFNMFIITFWTIVFSLGMPELYPIWYESMNYILTMEI